jgi:hypothetical protein
MRILGSKRGEIIRKYRKLRNEEEYCLLGCDAM